MAETLSYDSLRDLEDLSLKFSVDGDFKLNGELDAATRQKELIEALTRMASSNGNSSVSYHSGRRQGLFVIAADCYDSNGDCTERLPAIIKNVMKSTSSGLNLIGFVLLTGLSLQEILEKLRCCQVNLEEIDALVCNSGIEIYYPWRDLIADLEYEAHVENRWPGESVRSVVTRLAQGEGGAEDDIVEYAGVCSTRCYSYGVKPGAKVRLLLTISYENFCRG